MLELKERLKDEVYQPAYRFATTGLAQTCDEFRTGYFDIKSVDGMVFSVERTEEYQIEKVRRKALYFKITWTSDCAYKLILDDRHKVRTSNDRKPIRMKLTPSKEDALGYSFTMSLNGRTYSQGGTANKVGDLIEEEVEIAKGY